MSPLRSALMALVFASQTPGEPHSANIDLLLASFSLATVASRPNCMPAGKCQHGEKSQGKRSKFQLCCGPAQHHAPKAAVTQAR